MIENLLHIVYEPFFSSVEECKTRMESMRTMYRKILKKQRDFGPDVPLSSTEKDIQRQCSFLKKHLRAAPKLRINLTPTKKTRISPRKRKQVIQKAVEI